jgi:hypothetical protein
LIEPAGHGDHGAHGSESRATSEGHLPPDLTAREIGVLLPLAALCLYLGVQPSPLIRSIEDPINQTVRLVRGAALAGADTTARPGAAERRGVEGHTQDAGGEVAQ